VLPQNTITRDVQRGQHTEKTTIDLVFASTALSEQVKRCRIAYDLEQGSDHLPIETEFEWLSLPVKEPPPKREWKKLDSSKFTAAFLQTFTDSGANELPLTSREKIDNYIKDVTHAIRTGIEASTL
jgi:hypothetical protein